MPKTIAMPKRGDYTYLWRHPFEHKYEVHRLKLTKRFFKDLWQQETTLKPVYVKHDELWWRIMAIDWEGKELLIAVEGAETTAPLKSENDELVSFMESIIEQNKKQTKSIKSKRGFNMKKLMAVIISVIVLAAIILISFWVIQENKRRNERARREKIEQTWYGL